MHRTTFPTAFFALAILAAPGCGSAIDNPAGLDLSVGDAAAPDMAMPPQTGCDLVEQNCDDTSTKCTLLLATDDTSSDTEICLPVKGTGAEGDSCTRTTFGDDDCGSGLACTLRGSASDDLRCRQFCYVKGDCPSGQVCTSDLSEDLASDGICVPTCTPFSSACGGGNDCSSIYSTTESGGNTIKLALACRSAGDTPIGADCTSPDANCVAGSFCAPVSQTKAVCAQLCDMTHPCPAPADGGTSDGGAGSTCRTLPSLTIGVCR